MSAHCSLEILSTYVDAELPELERLEVESHVEKCDDCRSRLARLQGVVGQLHRLEQIEAPPTLGWQVQRRVRLESGRVPLNTRLEDRLGRLLRQPLLAPLFAVIVAFGAILYLFSLGVAKQTVSGTQVVIGGAVPTDAPPEAVAAAPVDQEDALAGSPVGTANEAPARLERMADNSAKVSLSSQQGLPGTLLLAGREFRLTGDVWKELGLGNGDPATRISLATGEDLPVELEELRQRAGVYRLLWDGRIVEVVISESDVR